MAKKGCQSAKLAVNFSVHQLNHPDVIRKIKKILNKIFVVSKDLEIEVTESIAVDDGIQIRETLNEIKKYGD